MPTGYWFFSVFREHNDVSVASLLRVGFNRVSEVLIQEDLSLKRQLIGDIIYIEDLLSTLWQESCNL